MAFNGSGVFARLYNWVNDANAGIKIKSDRMDAEMNGFATGLSTAICKDGQTVITANLPMAGFRHTGVGNASLTNHYAAAGQVQNGAFIWIGTTTGTNTVTATCTPTLTAYAAGQKFRGIIGGTCTGAVTLNLDGLGALAVQKLTTALVAGDQTQNDVCEWVHDGTQFQLTTPARTPVLAAGSIGNAALASASVGASNLVTTIIHDLTAKTTLTGADEFAMSDSAASNAAKKITYTNLLAALSTAKPATTFQYLTAGTAATYTTAPNCKAIRIKMVGAGGGGGAETTNNGAAGGDTIFNSIHAAGGSGGLLAGTAVAGGAGGTGGTGSANLRIAGGDGQSGQSVAGSSQAAGGTGGNSVFGGGGRSGSGSGGAGQPGKANSGGGGGGAMPDTSHTAPSGGGAGEYVEIYISNPSATYTYTIGAVGAGGSAGGFAGGAGGTGMIIVEEYY